MRKAKVWNDSNAVWKENFKGDILEIPAHGSIDMEFYDAHEFKSQFYPVRVTGDGGPDERDFKRIRVEAYPEEKGKTDEKPTHICQACAYGAMSREDLEAHIDERHLDTLEDKSLADDRRKKQKTA